MLADTSFDAKRRLEDSTVKLSYLLEFTINDGQLEVFKEKVTGYIKAVREGEARTLTYEWSFEESRNRCKLLEVFETSDALLTHFGNVGPSLPDLTAIAPITRLETFCEVSTEARAAVGTLGAKHFADFAGFTRTIRPLVGELVIVAG